MHSMAHLLRVLIMKIAAGSCCCGHGGKCTCSIKKEHLDPVPESDSDEPAVAGPSTTKSRRPRGFTGQSDGALTVFTNGHHKPATKHNKMAHQCGLPYVVPRAHSIHGPSPSGLANRSVDSLPHTNTIDALHSESHIKDSMVSAQQEQRKVRSEHNSPVLDPVTNGPGFMNGMLAPLDMTNIDGFSNAADYGFNNFSFNDGLNNGFPEQDQPIFSAGLSGGSVDWSHYVGLDFNNDSFNTSPYAPPASYSAFDISSVDQPGLTTSTSGEISEAEDFVHADQGARPTLGSRYGSDFELSEYGEPDSYHVSSSSSYLGLSSAGVSAGTDFSNTDLEDFLKIQPPITSAGFMPTTAAPTPAPMGSSGFGEGFGELKTSRLPTNDDFSLPLLDESEDSMWMNDFTSSTFTLEPSATIQSTSRWTQ